MNDDAANNATNQPISLKNDAIQYASVFNVATPSDTAAASTIALDAYFLSSRLKLDNEIFSKGNINHMADEDTLYTTSDPNAPNNDTSNASAQDSVSTDFNSPYSLINSQICPLLHQHHEKPERDGKQNLW